MELQQPCSVSVSQAQMGPVERLLGSTGSAATAATKGQSASVSANANVSGIHRGKGSTIWRNEGFHWENPRKIGILARLRHGCGCHKPLDAAAANRKLRRRGNPQLPLVRDRFICQYRYGNPTV